MPEKFPFFKQLDTMDCGPTCLRMISKYYGKNYSLQYLRDKCYIDRRGVSLLGISDAAELIGFRTMPIKIPYSDESDNQQGLLDVPLPCTAHWEQNILSLFIKSKKIIFG